MDSSVSLVTLLILLSCGVTYQMEVETTSLASSSSSNSPATTSSSGTSAPSSPGGTTAATATNTVTAGGSTVNIPAQAAVQQKPCITGKGEEGECVARQRCDYGTTNIDFTLYVPRNYVKKCSLTEVCCPENYIVKVAEHSAQKNDFTFDDDD